MQAQDETIFKAIEAYKGGNGEKATYIYESTKKYAYSIIYQQVSRFKNQGVITGDVNEFAEDVMQELYLNFFNDIQKFQNENEKSIYKWISVVSYRIILDCVDKNKMEVLQFAKDEDCREESDIWDASDVNDGDLEGDHEMLPEAALEDKEFRQLILDFINELPEVQAQTILLHFQGGMKYQEIADEMVVSLITVKTRIKKAKDSLEEIITKYEKKTGTKLHSVSILPLLWLLYRMAAEDTVVPAAVDTAVAGSVMAKTSVAAVGTGEIVTAGTGKVAGAVFAKAISTKVLVGNITATVDRGGVAVGSQLIEKKQEPVKREAVENTLTEKKGGDKKEENIKEEVNSVEDTESNEDSSVETETSVDTNNASTTKPDQADVQPSGAHTHSWTEVKTAVQVPETGHYEIIYGQKTECCACQADLTGLTTDERNEHFKNEPCKEGMYRVSRVETGKKWIVDTPATTEYRVTSYKCSCGVTREKTQYAGMYSIYDQTSWDRLEACKQFFAKGLAGADSDIYTNSIQYGNWESVVVCNGSTNGAWMWVFIRDWKLDNYDYLKDTVAQGIIDQAEADLVKALYEEIPSIFKGAIECIAPQGGTEVYNYVVNLINQANGDLVEVPNLSGAQGLIPENIPGLYVTIEETRGGFSVMFWAE